MRKSRFSDEQIALAIRQVEGGVPVARMCRKLGISERSCASDGQAQEGTPRKDEASPREQEALSSGLLLSKSLHG